MKLQRFIHEMMVATPLVVMLALGIQARTSPPDFEPYVYSDALHEKLLAYGSILRYTEEHGVRSTHSSEFDTYRRVAQEWVRRANRGELEALPSENALDTMREGVKAEIRSAVVNLSNGLNRESRSLPVDQVEARLSGFELSVELHGLIRYSDHYAMGYAAARTQAWVETLLPLVDRLTTSQLRRLDTAIRVAQPDPNRLALMMCRAERQFMRDGRRWGQERMGSLVPAVSAENGAEFDKQLRQLIMANGDDPAFMKQSGGVLFAQTALDSQQESLADLQRAIRVRLATLTAAESR